MAEHSPLHELTAKAGATFTEQAGWLMPARYRDVLLEYHEARKRAAILDVSHRAKLTLAGKDRATFLQGFCTNDVVRLQPGHGCEAFVTDGRAKTLARIRVFALPEVLWLDADPGLNDKLLQHLDRYLITEQVELADRTGTYAQLCLTGPSSPHFIYCLLDAQVSATQVSALNDLQLIGLGDTQIRRNDGTGSPGYDLVFPTTAAQGFWQTLTLLQPQLAGLEAYNMLRVEAGSPEYGVDIDETNLPQEVGRDARAISFTKGCYLGQETICRIRDMGHVNRYLVGLKLNTKEPVAAGAKVFRDGQEIGHVTSSVYSLHLDRAIALAYVRRGSQEPGTAVELVGGQSISATVEKLPFVEK